jgi:2-methylisocitrate lyase-like PEP mutase family enzyme
MSKRKKFRELLLKKQTITIPGIYDCMSAKIVEKLGFSAAFISGYSVSASILGKPDVGLVSKAELVNHARNIAASVNIPIICDADTGFGNAVNVWDTVNEFSQTGIAGIEIEDQDAPKKCGYLTNRAIISIGEMQGKIKAAVNARGDGDFVIIGRSDARGVIGVDEAIKRYNAYLEAGADMVIIAESYSIEELKKAAKEINGPLGVAGGIPGRPETMLTTKEYEDMGVNMVVFGLSSLYAAAHAILNIYTDLAHIGNFSADDYKSRMMGFDAFNELIGLHHWAEIESRYLRE